MAQNVIINGVTYSDVPEVNIPKSGGGTARFYDTASGNLTAANLLTGKVGYGASGAVSGSMANNGSTSGTISTKAGTVIIPAGYTTGGTVALDPSAIADLQAGNLLAGKTVLGVAGSLSVPTVSQDSTTKILTIQ